MDKLSLEDAIKESTSIIQKASPKFTFIINKLVSEETRDYLALIHGYLRWIDDFIDDPNNSVTEKRLFINRQQELITSYRNNSEIKPLENEEYFLYYFVEYALENNIQYLIESAALMMEVIAMDVMRLEKDGTFSNDQLNDYIRKQLKATHTVLFYFIYNMDFTSSEYEKFEINNANIKMLMLRDLKEDIDAGLINISREDIEKYGLNINNLKNDKNMNLWISDQVRFIIDTLYSEIAKIKVLPFKIKTLYLFFSTYYLPKIIRYKFYGYFVGSFENKSLPKDIYTHFYSLWINLNLIRKIYFR